MEIATKLLVCAGTLMLIAGAIFGFLGQWYPSVFSNFRFYGT